MVTAPAITYQNSAIPRRIESVSLSCCFLGSASAGGFHEFNSVLPSARNAVFFELAYLLVVFCIKFGVDIHEKVTQFKKKKNCYAQNRVMGQLGP